MFESEVGIMNKFLTIAGCFTVIGTLVLFSPQQAQAQFGAVGVADPGPNFTPPRVGEPPTVERRTYLCFEEWQKSYAHTKQLCDLVLAKWDSYRITPSYYSVDEGTHMKYSRCRISVECKRGFQSEAIGVAKHNSVLEYKDVNQLRRCKIPSLELNTHCDPLTPAELDEAVAQYIIELEPVIENILNENNPLYGNQANNTGNSKKNR